MKRNSIVSRLLAFAMAVVICCSLVPWTVFAAETGSYTQVMSAEEFTSGQYVLITDTGYAPGVLDGSWITALTPSVADGKVTDTAGAIWTLTVDGSSVKMTDANGVTVAPKGGNNNGITSGDYSWDWSFADGKLTFAGVDSDTVVLASNAASENRFRAYKTSTVSSAAGYPCMFTAYKLVESEAEPQPSEPEETAATDATEGIGDNTPAWNDVDARYDVYELVSTLTDGDTVVLFNPGNAKALSSEDSAYDKAGVEMAVVDDHYIASDSDCIAWTMSVDENGVYTFTQGDLKLGIEASDSYFNLKTNSGDHGFTVVPYAEGSDVFNIYSATLEGSYGHVYLQWYASKSAFSAYCTGEDRLNETNFGFQFYKLIREGVVVEETEPPAEPTESTEPSEPTEPTEPTDPAIPERSGIADGDYVIWVPGYNKALSCEKTGNYNVGVEVAPAGEGLSGYGATEIWTVENHEDGTITISQDGSRLSLAESGDNLTMDDANDTWMLINLGGGLFHVQNVGRGNYLEWYDKYSNWSTYNTSSAATDDQFRIMFTPAERSVESVTDSSVVEDIANWSGLTKEENTAFIYGDKYISGDEKDSEDTFTAVVSGQIITPWTEGGSDEAPLYCMGGAGLGSGTEDYLQFAVNAEGWGDMELTCRLRSSNSGPGSFQLKYSTDNGATWQNFTTGYYAYVEYSSGESDTISGEITDGIAKTSLAPARYVSFVFDVPADADNCAQLLIRLVPGSENAKGSGNAASGGTVRVEGVVLSGSPVIRDDITGFVTVDPDGTEDQPVGTKLTMTSGTNGATIYYRVNGGEWLTYDPENKPTLETLPCDIEAYAASEGKADSVVLLYHYAPGTVETVQFSPDGGTVYIEDESAEITLSTVTEGATIYYATSTDGEEFTEFSEYTAPVVVNKGFEKLTIRAYAQKEGCTASTVAERTFTERSCDTWQLYFGQLHAHTGISDGAGTIEEAYAYAANVDGLDFLAVTDHSNSFDNEESGVLAEDGTLISEEWKQAKAAAEAVTVPGEFVGLYGFEMTWSGGSPGHISTFNTPGWQSRNQEPYQDKSMTALQNYYNALATVPESISQFNHPGTTYGDFFDFGCYSESADELITLIEVGSGEGTIGSSGYFPAYEYYTRALDKGWHVAPTNNQNNHEGMWGDANTGRSVILAQELTEEGIYDALRNYRVYATEDKDLEIYYTLNGSTMGTILKSTGEEENVTISVSMIDPTDGLNGTLEVIVNGGLTAASFDLSNDTDTVELTVPAGYSYYYIRIIQADGDTAVTAPVWVEEVETVGISCLEVETDLCIAGDEQTITAEMFNNGNEDLIVETLVYTDKQSGEVLYTDTALTAIPKEGTATSSFRYTFTQDGVYTITATLKGILDGREKVCTRDLEITVMPGDLTSRIIVDGTHYNAYVSGYNPGNMGNMIAIAGAHDIDVHVEMEKITPEMLENCSLLIISAPNTRTGESYPLSAFEDDFLAMVADYVKDGGNVVVCGMGDCQDMQNDGIHETSVQLNNLLAAIGASMRIQDDEACDTVNNGGDADRLHLDIFNMDSQWCEGIVKGQEYLQYSGCTVDPGNGIWLVKGHDTTCSIDADQDGKGGVGQGEAVFMAAESTGFGGTVFVAGGVFLSDYAVKAEMGNDWDLPCANRTIYENIIGITRQQPEIMPIAQVRDSAEAELGSIFTIEGYVTAGTANPDTTFFDTIYVQDGTGGIAVFSYSESGLQLGTKVRITGSTDACQGDIGIRVMSLEILEEPRNVIKPETVSAKDAMNYAENGGELLQVQGEVVEVVLDAGDARTVGQGVSQFVVKDAKGDLAKIFIDSYIFSGTTGENTLAEIVRVGNTVSAVGLLYMHAEGDSETSVAVLRVRDCDEVVLIREQEEEPSEPSDPSEPTEPSEPSEPTEPSEPSDPTEPSEPSDPSEPSAPSDPTESTEPSGSSKPETDKSELEKAVKLAKTKKQKGHTRKSYTAMRAVLKVAEKVLADENATQEEIDAATDALIKAINALTPTTGRNPGTSDSASIGLTLFVMTASLLAIAALLCNRKRFIV